MATDSLQHGIVFSLSAALGGAVLALVWRRLLWLAGLSLAFAAVIFCAHYFGVVCTSKKVDTCDPLFSFLDPRPSLPWRER